MDKTSKQIWNLAIPSIISNITTPLLGLVDIAIVGHLDSTSLIGAVAVSSMTFNMIYWIFGFLRMGTSGMTAQALGKKQFGEVLQILVHAFTIAMAIALGLILLQLYLSENMYMGNSCYVGFVCFYRLVNRNAKHPFTHDYFHFTEYNQYCSEYNFCIFL